MLLRFWWPPSLCRALIHSEVHMVRARPRCKGPGSPWMITLHLCHRQAADLPGLRQSSGHAFLAFGSASCAHLCARHGRFLPVAGGVILLAFAVWMAAAATSPL